MENPNFEERLAELLYKRFIDSLSQDEVEELNRMCKIPGVTEFIEKLSASYIGDQLKVRNNSNVKSAWRRVRREVVFMNKVSSTSIRSKVAIAASLIFLICVGVYIYEVKVKIPRDGEANVEELIGDIYPAGGTALLKLSSGRMVKLSDINGANISEVNVDIENVGQSLEYKPKSDVAKEVINTLTTSKGCLYKLKLADGSTVWLNSGSTIRFPASFVKSERVVEIQGEAFFDVVKDELRPFVVLVNDLRIEVLGTQFNVSSYITDSSINTTLTQGSVKIAHFGYETKLKPGQQCQAGKDSLKVTDKFDVDEVLAWRRNEFNFQYKTLPEIIVQLQRVYDFDVEYLGEIHKDRFVAKFSRSVPLSQVLEVLEQTGKVKFEIRGRKVLVKYKL